MSTSNVTSFSVFLLRYSLTLAASDIHIYPSSIEHKPCCPEQECVTKIENGTAVGAVREQLSTIIILEGSKCKQDFSKLDELALTSDGKRYRRHRPRIRKYKPVRVQVSVSCNCIYLELQTLEGDVRNSI